MPCGWSPSVVNVGPVGPVDNSRYFVTSHIAPVPCASHALVERSVCVDLPIRFEPEWRAVGLRRGCRRAAFLPEVYHAHHEAEQQQDSGDKREGEERSCDEDCDHAEPSSSNSATFATSAIRLFNGSHSATSFFGGR